MSLKVTIERSECIACCNCHTECPEVFELNPDDGLAQIVKEYRSEDPGKGQIPDTLEACVQIAVDLCPVEIIQLLE